MCAKDLCLTHSRVFCFLGPFPPFSPAHGVCLGFLSTSGHCCHAEAISEAAGGLTKAPQGSCSRRWVSIRHCLWRRRMHTRAHSPVELRCDVEVSSWTHALGLKENSWNKSCVYKGQLELQWQWRGWNIAVPGTSYIWPWSSAIPQELFLAHICVRPSILIND